MLCIVYVDNDDNMLESCVGSILFISSSKDVMSIMFRYRMHEYEVPGAYIVQDLLEDTSTASALALIGQLHKVKVSCIGAESVCKNCDIGRCFHLHICILLQEYLGK